MKRVLIISVLVASSMLIYAQDDGYRTIFDGGDFRISGFGGPCMSFTSIDGQFAHMMGGGGGVMIGDFFFGGYGMGKTSATTVEYDGSTYDIDFGHGGLWFGYFFFASSAVHPSIHLQTGWGSIDEDMTNYNRSSGNYLEDNVFVLVPTLEMELNFTRFFRVSAGASYRMVYGTDDLYFGLTDSDMASPSAFLAFKFGWF